MQTVSYQSNGIVVTPDEGGGARTIEITSQGGIKPTYLFMLEDAKDGTDSQNTCLTFKNHNGVLCVPEVDAARIIYNPAAGNLLFAKELFAVDYGTANTARILLYWYNQYNWCGIGVDTYGIPWIKVGTEPANCKSYSFSFNGLFQVPLGVAYSTVGSSIRSYNSGNLWLEVVSDVYVRGPENTGYKTIYAGNFVNSSSRRYKENIQPMMEEEARKVLDVEVVTFDYINKEDGTDCRGVIAEDVQNVIPSVVTLNQEGLPEGVNYSKFVPYLIKMVQELEKEVQTLKMR